MNDMVAIKLIKISVFTMIFTIIPKVIQLDFISSGYGSQLSFYPLFVLSGYTIWRYRKNDVTFPLLRPFMKFIIIYMISLLLICIIGLYQYPYYDKILDGPISQIDKLPKILSFLGTYNIFVTKQTILPIWMIIRIIKANVLNIIYTFGFSYILYYWFQQDWKYGFTLVRKGVYISLVIVFIYSFFEIFYFMGNDTATYILKIFNPIIHEVQSNQTWWPPLLWENQARSIFAEPSYFGIYATFVLPFLWYDIFQENCKKKVLMAIFILSFLVFLTKARTAFVVFLVENILLVIFTILLRKSLSFRKTGVIIICGIISFVFSNIFISQFMNNPIEKNINIGISNSMKNYVNDNAATLVDTQARSNGARYSIIIANFNIALDHPLVGVGLGLRDAYITEYLPDMAVYSYEVQQWVQNQKDRGILKAGYPNLCEYMTRFSETGIIGLSIFLYPMLYLFYLLYCKIKEESYKKRLPYIIFLISFIGMCIKGIGDSLNTTYYYWLLLGLGYAMCLSNKRDKKDED